MKSNSVFDGETEPLRRNMLPLVNEYIIFMDDKPVDIDAMSVVEEYRRFMYLQGLHPDLSGEVIRLLGHHNGVPVYHDPYSGTGVVSVNRDPKTGVTFIIGGHDDLRAYIDMMDRFNIRK